MFSILVTGNPAAWETDQLMRMPRGRCFKAYCDSACESISADRPETLKLLEGTAALLMYESGRLNGSADIVRYGYLRDIRISEYDLAFYFSEEGVFTRAVVEEFASRLGMQRLEQHNTHWAVKDGHIPRGMLARLRQSYDVVFSFAGEDRAYVEQTASYLASHGIKVFYDDFEEASLWGKDLAEHFDLVYRRSGRYCVLFISEHYARKPWTQHERRFAVARALEESTEYILPARFDATEIPGVSPTIKHISLREKTPTDLAELLLKKLGHSSSDH